jgi:hypothetical protein
MLHVLKSIAAYLEATTSFDVFASTPCMPSLGAGATPGSSAIASGSVGMLVDSETSAAIVTTTSSAYVELTWSAAKNVDGIRYYWPAGATAPTVKVRGRVGVTWLDITGSTAVALAVGWNTIRFTVSQAIDGVRVQYVSGGNDAAMRCSELGAYDDLRIEPAPSDFGDGGFYVLHPDLDLTDADVAIPLITIGDTAQNYDVGELGNLTRQDRLSAIIGLHCASEDQLDRHTHWAKMILDAALSPDSAGTLYPGIPLRGLRYPLANISGGDWWSSGQKGWFASPAPVVRVGGVITAATQTDPWRGRVLLTGTSHTADVRADFTCGVFDFIVKGSVRAGIESPAQILHRHNAYLILESDTQFHAVQDALT